MATEINKDKLLKNFLEEFFDFTELKKAGLFDKTFKKNDYQKQADRLCTFFGFKTIYEYGSREIRCHLSYVDSEKSKKEPFVTVIPNIYES